MTNLPVSHTNKKMPPRPSKASCPKKPSPKKDETADKIASVNNMIATLNVENKTLKKTLSDQEGRARSPTLYEKYQQANKRRD